MQQVGLAQPHTAVEKKRIIRFARRLRDGQGGGVREIIIVANDERVELVLRIEIQILTRRDPFGDRLRGFAPAGQSHRGDGMSAAGRDLKPNLQFLSRGDGQHVLDQAQVVVFEPDLAEIVGDFEHEAVVVFSTGTQRCEPEIIDVCAEHGTELFTRRTPDLFCLIILVLLVQGTGQVVLSGGVVLILLQGLPVASFGQVVLSIMIKGIPFCNRFIGLRQQAKLTSHTY